MTAVSVLPFVLVLAARPSDEVTDFPGYLGTMPSKVFSGYIRATAAGQTFLSHYVLTESQRDPAADPLLLWQQGGPGSSGFGYGYLAELGPYRLDADSMIGNGTTPVPQRNVDSWDRVSNLLLFEHPPGTGFSYCVDDRGKPTPCKWNDQTQAEAFYATLAAWYDAWPAYASHELRVIGESYAGLLIPFLAFEIYSKHPTGIPARQLKGIAIGNGCPGTAGSTPTNTGTRNGTHTPVKSSNVASRAASPLRPVSAPRVTRTQSHTNLSTPHQRTPLATTRGVLPRACRARAGPYGNYDTQHVLELAHGHGALPRAQWEALVKTCEFPCAAPTWSESCATFSMACEELISSAHDAIGSFNIYDFYDNCGDGNQAGAALSGAQHRARLNGPAVPRHTGGQSYGCGTGKAATVWANEPAVRAALHMHPASFYGYNWSLFAGAAMQYDHYTGSSYDLYPCLLNHTSVLIYNGDVDGCVPYSSNADWIVALAAQQGWEQAEAWRPWTLRQLPAGYVTRYDTKCAHNLTFLTIKQAGHMVPQYQPVRFLFELA